MVQDQEKKMGMSRKNRNILFLLSFLVFTAGIYKYFIGTGIRADIFLFSSYVTPDGKVGKYVSMILYELNYMFTTVVLLFIIRNNAILKSTKNIISPFLVISIIDVFDYICFYKQMSYYKLPLLVLLILIYNRSWLIKSKKK